MIEPVLPAGPPTRGGPGGPWSECRRHARPRSAHGRDAAAARRSSLVPGPFARVVIASPNPLGRRTRAYADAVRSRVDATPSSSPSEGFVPEPGGEVFWLAWELTLRFGSETLSATVASIESHSVILTDFFAVALCTSTASWASCQNLRTDRQPNLMSSFKTFSAPDK